MPIRTTENCVYSEMGVEMRTRRSQNISSYVCKRLLEFISQHSSDPLHFPDSLAVSVVVWLVLEEAMS